MTAASIRRYFQCTRHQPGWIYIIFYYSSCSVIIYVIRLRFIGCFLLPFTIGEPSLSCLYWRITRNLLSEIYNGRAKCEIQRPWIWTRGKVGIDGARVVRKFCFLFIIILYLCSSKNCAPYHTFSFVWPNRWKEPFMPYETELNVRPFTIIFRI